MFHVIIKKNADETRVRFKYPCIYPFVQFTKQWTACSGVIFVDAILPVYCFSI